MKILQVITLTELGGAQTVVANLANELSRNHELIVAGGEGNGQMWSLLNSRIKTENVVGLVRRISPTNELRAIQSLRKLYKKYHPDIIHLHSSKAGLLGRLVFPKSKIVYTVHGFDSIRVAFRQFLPLEKLFQYKTASIIGVSKYDYANMQSEGIIKNIGYIYNGVSKPNELETDPFQSLREEFHKGLVLCIARLNPQKNHQLFIETARLMPETAFVWIGNISEPDFDIPENCRFIGNIPNAASYCYYADVFFLPSNYEGLPMVILESLACGTPVVASNVGGISEILNGQNGYTIENKPEAAVEAISKILADRSPYSEVAIETYQKRFTIGQMASNYENLYYKLIER